MGRFDAATEADRRSLIAEAVAAHRRRASGFCTFVAEVGGSPAPWVQFADHDSLCNLDCTDDEYRRLERFLDEHGGLSVVERTRPEDAAGTNVRLRLRGDEERVARVIERLFREVFDRPADYRLWATAI